MSDRKLPNTAKILIEAKKLIENIEDWCPEGRGLDGIRHMNDGRVQRCAVVALSAAAARTGVWMECSEILRQATNRKSHHSMIEVIKVNAQGHDAVMKLYDKAISMAINEANND